MHFPSAYTCETCGKAFGRGDSLPRHQITCHLAGPVGFPNFLEEDEEKEEKYEEKEEQMEKRSRDEEEDSRVVEEGMMEKFPLVPFPLLFFPCSSCSEVLTA